MDTLGEVDVSVEVARDGETPRSLPNTGGVLEPFLAGAVLTVSLSVVIRRILGRAVPR